MTSSKPDSRRLSAYAAGLQVVRNHFVAGSEDGDGRGHHLLSTGFFFFSFNAARIDRLESRGPLHLPAFALRPPFSSLLLLSSLLLSSLPLTSPSLQLTPYV